MSEAKEKKTGYLRQAWLVLLLAMVFGTALAGVHLSLGGRIEANKSNETLDQIPELVPGSAGGEPVTIGTLSVYEAQDSGGKRVGWILPASGLGFADRIELLIGLAADGQEIVGLYVLDQKETPGLGNKIEAQRWREQFAGKWATGAIEVVKVKPAPQANAIQAVTGATVSSKAVADTVNTAVVAFRKALAAENK